MPALRLTLAASLLTAALTGQAAWAGGGHTPGATAGPIATARPTATGRPMSSPSPTATRGANGTTSTRTAGRTATPSPAASPSLSPAPSLAEATAALHRQQKALAAERATLATAALAAGAALQAYQQSRTDAADAAEAARGAVLLAASAGRVVVTARGDLRSYAGSMYRFGRVDPRLLIVSAALGAARPQQFFAGLDLARQVGEKRARVLTSLTVAQEQQAQAAAEAGQAAQQQAEAAARAAVANDVAKRAVAAYRVKVAQRQAELALSTTALERARSRSKRLDTAGGGAWASLPLCAGGDLAGFDNGRLPVDALCPLALAPGMKLRSDAAYAFNGLATEYAATFGTPLCVADAYRSYEAQVAVRAEKPLLAAHPGRSNHGWGIAADLCGGIESFASPEHRWMLDNAILFGWFHPAWAEPTGARPEPWHWEFAG